MTAADGFKGHAWVFEGVANYICKRMKETYYRDGTSSIEIVSRSISHDLLYCNWGWNGIGDGYYNKGVFNTAERQWLDTTIDRDVMPTNHHNYTWAFRLVTFTR